MGQNSTFFTWLKSQKIIFVWLLCTQSDDMETDHEFLFSLLDTQFTLIYLKLCVRFSVATS